MIPRALPKLTTDALHAGWNVDITHRYAAILACFDRGDDTVRIEWWWTKGRFTVDASSINREPTPYAQCTHLIRSPEGA